jgi:hypothetical protein
LIWAVVGLLSFGRLDTIKILTKKQAIQKVKELKNLAGIKDGRQDSIIKISPCPTP